MSLESDINESKRVVEPVDDEDCAVFFEPLANDAKRTVVNLQCSHRFHLGEHQIDPFFYLFLLINVPFRFVWRFLLFVLFCRVLL